MKCSVVTFSVQLGSSGEEVARRVAQDLGFRFIDRDVTVRAADAAGVSSETIAQAERWPSFLQRMLETLSVTAAYSDSMLQPPQVPLLTMTSADYRRLVETVIGELASQGNCVIVGHAAQAILKSRPGVLKVLVHGSEAARTDRFAGQQGIMIEAARDEIERADHQRIEFFHHVYDLPWLDSSVYDMTINTDSIEVADAAASVATAAGSARS